jgi:hypothetical protein
MKELISAEICLYLGRKMHRNGYTRQKVLLSLEQNRGNFDLGTILINLLRPKFTKKEAEISNRSKTLVYMVRKNFEIKTNLSLTSKAIIGRFHGHPSILTTSWSSPKPPPSSPKVPKTLISKANHWAINCLPFKNLGLVKLQIKAKSSKKSHNPPELKNTMTISIFRKPPQG